MGITAPIRKVLVLLGADALTAAAFILHQTDCAPDA